MFKIFRFCLFVVLLSSLNAESIQKFNKDNEKVFELMADLLNTANQIIHANGNAILVNKDLYVLAEKIDYDIEKRMAEVRGDVRIYRDGNLLVKTSYASFRLDDKYGFIEPLYLQESDTGMWIKADAATSNNKVYSFKKSTLSTCNIQNPIWRMEASSGKYSNITKYVTLWNPKLYIGDVPIFYFPYFLMKAHKERSTGFLVPTFYTSSTEGFITHFPFFLAPKTSWDMTFKPQIRTERGVGGTIEFRNVDSSNDRTFLELGYLYNFKNYSLRYNLKNDHIYGFRFYHNSNQALQKYFKLKSDIENGIYIRFSWLNDLDYFRLDKPNRRIYDLSTTSKVNAYIQSQDHYFGLHARYFQNLIKMDDRATMQSLPNLQYHKYLDSVFWRGIMYSIDYQMKNSMRVLGYGYIENSLRIPIGFQVPLLFNYVSVGFWNDLYGEILDITNYGNSYIPALSNDNFYKNNGFLLSANYSVSINSDIAKAYNKFFHSIQFEALFSGPWASYSRGLLDRRFGLISAEIRKKSLTDKNLLINDPNYSLNQFPILQNGQYTWYDDIWDPSGISSYSIINQTLDLKLSQYFLNNQGKELFNLRIFQRLNFDELTNSLNIKNGSISSNVIAKRPMEIKASTSIIPNLNLSLSGFYSFYAQEFSELAATAGYHFKYFQGNVSYFYKNKEAYDFISNTTIAQTGAQFLRLQLSQDFRYLTLGGSLGYDFDKNTFLDWDIGIYKNIRCFGIGLKFTNRRRPILTNNENNPYMIQQDYLIRLLFNFSPLVGSGLTTRF